MPSFWVVFLPHIIQFCHFRSWVKKANTHKTQDSELCVYVCLCVRVRVSEG